MKKFHNWKIIETLKALVENLQKQNDLLEKQKEELLFKEKRLEDEIAVLKLKLAPRVIGDKNWDEGTTIAFDENDVPAMRKTCEACWKEFETHRKWERRCNPCREANKPYTKKVFNNNQEPF